MSHISDHWEVEEGIGQGAVLSGFLFNILINGLAAAIKRACNGVSCDSGDNSLRVRVLLYADDVVILCENAVPHNLPALQLHIHDLGCRHLTLNFPLLACSIPSIGVFMPDARSNWSRGG